MCGIAGIYNFQDEPVDGALLRSMASALAHRGPDDQGFHIDHNIGLASRRLAVIDLSQAASQPMHDESSRFFLIYNGEIYNFRDLRKDLESNYQFFSNSDTEVILRLFQQYSSAAWPRLNGMFAIAIWDSKNRELYLARDHAGIKPLYYSADSRRIIFASDLPALLRCGVSSELNHQSISLYLQLGYFPGTHTPYKAVSKLLPGHSMKVDSTGIQIQRFWSIRDHYIERSHVEAPETQLEQCLSISVSRQMISDVPIGAFLSGGIDSSFVVALMSRASEQVKTFTVGFPGMGYYDERQFADRVARHFRTEHHEFSIEGSVRDVLPEVVSASAEPFADPSAIPTYSLAKHTRQYVTVALSGTGGDELFGGYRKYLASQWTGLYLKIPDSIRSGIRKSASFLPSSRQTLWKERALLLKRFLEVSPDFQEGVQLNLIFRPEELSGIMDPQQVLNIQFQPISGTVAENMMLFDFEFYLPEDLLLKEDRSTMAFGLEARVPFLDRELIEFTTRLPITAKVSLTQTKKLFRKVAARYLPAWVLKRPKHGFGPPVAEWLRTELKELARDTLFASKRFLPGDFARKKWEEHQKEASDHSRQLWTALILELWYQRTRSQTR